MDYRTRLRRLAHEPDLLRVLKVARSVLRDCDTCRLDESCYNCLQDYSNQRGRHPSIGFTVVFRHRPSAKAVTVSIRT